MARRAWSWVRGRSAHRLVQTSRQRRGRTGGVTPDSACVYEPLEPRRMLCADHGIDDDMPPPIELRPDLIGKAAPASASVGGAANIVWTNRGSSTSDSDGFNNVFGANAALARAVVDAVIVRFDQMIGSFNYADGSTNYNLSLSMGGASLGAGASLSTALDGKPKSGNVSMGSGTDGHGAGWFLDPTPFDSSEFQGNITNAFAGDAQTGSPASGKGDFFTVAAAEISHCLGLFGNSLPLWSSHTSNTGIADTAEGGGRGTFWVFQGPSIKHLLTSNNGGPNGSDPGLGAIHAAGPNVAVSFGGDTYLGAQDHGNAVYEFSRRYLIDNVFSLMFRDAYGYSTVNPAQFGTFYSVLNQTTGQVLVRGGTGTSADNISVSLSGSTITISVDVGNDIAGTGALAGAGNLPAFVTTYDISQVSSIVIQAGDGNDVINVSGISSGVPVTVSGGNGNDTITVGGSGGELGAIGGALVITGDAGTDTLTVDDSAAAANNIYVVTPTTITRNGFGGLSYSTFESMVVKCGAGDDTLNVNNTPSTTLSTFDAGPGFDTININDSGATLRLNASSGNDDLNINVDGVGAAGVQLLTGQQLGHLSIGNVGIADFVASGDQVLSVTGLSIATGGVLDLRGNRLVFDDGAAAQPDLVRAQLTIGNNSGTWSGRGIRSATASFDATHHTALGYAQATDLFSDFPATFGSASVNSTATLVRYTLYADANLDGIVDLTDFTLLAGNFNASGGASWYQGDFNYDGNVDLTDFTLLAANFNATVAPAGSVTSAAAAPLAAPVAAPRKAESAATANRDDLLGSVTADSLLL